MARRINAGSRQHGKVHSKFVRFISQSNDHYALSGDPTGSNRHAIVDEVGYVSRVCGIDISVPCLKFRQAAIVVFGAI